MKIPSVIQNIYRDLRDRRMLSIAIALIAAIIAVPFLLGGSGGESTSAPVTALTEAPFAGDEQLNPVVLAEAPGLRDFHERLAAFNSHNPFKDMAPSPERQGTGGGGSGETSTGAGGTGSDSGGASIEPPSSVPSAPGSSTDPGVSTGGDDGTVTDDGSDDGDGSGGGGATPQLISYRIDVRVGPLGGTKVVKDVQQLTFLPERKHPLLQFIDADDTGSRVAFIVNPKAAVLEGDGECVRDRKDCQYLVMEPKEEMYFLFDDDTYRIQLMRISAHTQPYTPPGKGSGGGSAKRGSSTLVGG